jgi:hypothetical protein
VHGNFCVNFIPEHTANIFRAWPLMSIVPDFDTGADGGLGLGFIP